ncbi:MAG: ABC transporter permease [Planctomycetes bacterium]|nr:ABC transporter permease [Planctomycetota bacterium]
MNPIRHALAALARYGIFVALVVEFALFSIWSPNFFSTGNQLNVLHQNAPILVLAIGMTFVILTAGIDLSVGSVVALTAVGAAQLAVLDWEPIGLRVAVAVIGGALLGAICGMVNGLVITKVRIPPFVATLAMMLVAKGAVLIATDARPISQGLPDLFERLGQGGGASALIHVSAMLALFVVAWVVLRFTAFGKHVYAVGNNPEAAHLCGIRVPRVLVAVYLGCGLLAGIGGTMLATQLDSGDPKLGELMELDAIAAVVVGGTSLMGGRGSIWGTLAGGLLIAYLKNYLTLEGLPFFWQKVVIGVALILAAFLDRFRSE